MKNISLGFKNDQVSTEVTMHACMYVCMYNETISYAKHNSQHNN